MSLDNIDHEEIEKFSKLAAHWWDKEGECKPLHEINPLRLQFINEKANLTQKKVIDVGCGGGLLTEGMAKLGAVVTGIDMSKPALKVAKLHQLESGTTVDYQHITAEEIAKTHADNFDIVTCLEMLEHVPHPESIIQACAKLVKQGGDVFFSTLNRNVKSYLFAIIGAEYLLKLLPKNTHDFAKFIKPAELSQMANNFGLTVKNMIGMQYNLISKRYYLTKDVSINYIMHFKKE